MHQAHLLCKNYNLLQFHLNNSKAPGPQHRFLAHPLLFSEYSWVVEAPPNVTWALLSDGLSRETECFMRALSLSTLEGELYLLGIENLI